MHNLKNSKIALVGASLNTKKYGHKIFRDLLLAGYDVTGINPKTKRILKQKIFPSLNKLNFKPELVIIVVPPKIALSVLQECAQLGLQNIWMQPGSESNEAISFAKKNKINLTTGACLMINQKLW